MLAGLLYAVAMLATREWCAGEGPFTLLCGVFAGTGVWGIIGPILVRLMPQQGSLGPDGFPWRLWGEMSGEAWIWTVAQALGSLIAVGLIIRAYQIGEASFVAVYEYGLLISVVGWGYLLLGQRIDIWAMAACWSSSSRAP